MVGERTAGGEGVGQVELYVLQDGVMVPVRDGVGLPVEIVDAATVGSGPSTPGALTDRSGTVTTGGTRQQVMAANATRKYLLFQNVSDTDMWVNFGTNAVADSPSIKIPANGGSFIMEGSAISVQALDVYCATTGKKYTAKELG